VTRSLKIKSALAVTSAFLALLTIVVPDWIEEVFQIDPDGGNGSLEWLIVIVFIVATVLFGMMARAELRARTA
jgi:hypothetical protein